MNPEELLAHADFVRSLARTLVLDDHRAADVSQQAWVAALRHPPSPEKPLRAWLSRVTRNFARKHHRGEARRRIREKASASPAGVPSPEVIAEREEIRRKVVASVQALDEPYRSVILLRFYEDLPHQEVARRLGIPLETMRTRLKRGLSQLRDRLDRSCDGDRKKWLLALAPFAGLGVSSSAEAAVAGSAKLSAGSFILSGKVKGALAALLLFGSALVFWQFLPEKDTEVTKASSLLSSEVQSGPGSGPEVAGLLAGTTTLVSGTPGNSAPMREPLKPFGRTLTGKVTDQRTGKAVTVYDIILKGKAGPGMVTKTVAVALIQDASGRFSLPIERGGYHDLIILSSRHPEYRKHDLFIPEKGDLEPLKISLDPGFTLTGRVLDGESRKPVAGAIVGSYSQRRLDLRRTESGLPPKGLHTLSRKDGTFSLEGIIPRAKDPFNMAKNPMQIVVLHPDFAEEVVDISALNDEVEVCLNRGYRIHGKAFPGKGAFAVRASGLRRVLTEADGMYTTFPVLPGEVTVTVRPLEGTYFQTQVIEVKDRDVELHFDKIEDDFTWRGTMYDHEGTPLAKGQVELWINSHNRGIGTPWVHISSECDEKGFFELRHLVPGECSVSVEYPGSGARMSWGVLKLDRPGVLEKDIHIHGGIVSGKVVNSLTGEPIPAGCCRLETVHDDEKRAFGPRSSPTGLSADIQEDGSFMLIGVLPGNYRVKAEVYEERWIFSSDDNASSKSEAFLLKNGESRRGLEIELTPAGRVHFKVRGLENSGITQIAPSFRYPGRRGDSSRTQPTSVKSNGNWEAAFTFDPGTWTVKLESGDVAFKKEIEVKPGRIIELVLDKEDFIREAGLIRVMGSLTCSDGSPVADARFSFVPSRESIDWTGDFPITLHCKTDSEGRFTVDGLVPLQWLVSVDIGESHKKFPPIVLDEDSENPYPLHLVIPKGSTITGMLYDRQSGRPLDKSVHFMHIWLVDMEKSEKNRDHLFIFEPRIDLKHVAPGTYQMTVKAYGYVEHVTDAFRLVEGETHSLGKIELDPAPFLTLVVVDPDGRPLGDRIQVTFPDREDLKTGSAGFGGVKVRYEVPPGKLKVRIEAPGYKSKEITVEIKAGKDNEVRVELEPSQAR